MPSFSSLKLAAPVLLLALSLPARAAAQGSHPRPLALVPATPAEVGMRADLPARVDSLIEAAIADGATPGAAVAIGRHGRLVVLRGYGHTDWAEGAVISPPPAVTDSTIYDMASLTKVTATTTAAMILQEEGKLDIDRPVHEYVPELSAPDKAGITVRMLLTHSGGFEAFAKLFAPENGSLRGREQYLKAINERPLAYEPGTRTIYSDWDFVLMQAVIEHITGKTLDRFTEERVFGPLGMRDTGFRPDASLKPRIAPTEIQTWRCGDVACPPGQTGG
jgi:CubicO group peptidase (beta-lactamase class C family)